MDEHLERLRTRVMEALVDNEKGALPDEDLIYVLETTCDLLERTHSSVRDELWAASADFESARYAVADAEWAGDRDDMLRAGLKVNARARARAALDR